MQRLNALGRCHGAVLVRLQRPHFEVVAHRDSVAMQLDAAAQEVHKADPQRGPRSRDPQGHEPANGSFSVGWVVRCEDDFASARPSAGI